MVVEDDRPQPPPLPRSPVSTAAKKAQPVEEEEKPADGDSIVAKKEVPKEKRAQTSFALAQHTLQDGLSQLARMSRGDVWLAMNQRLDKVGPLKALADLLGVSPAFVATATVTGALGFIFFGFGGQLLCTLVGALFPAFESYKAVETNDLATLRFWVMYWIVYAVISSVEAVAYYVVVALPFYYPLKMALLLSLCSHAVPTTYLYNWCVVPVFDTYREQIDDAIDQSKANLKQGLKRVGSGVLEAGVAPVTMGYTHVRNGLGVVGPLMLEAARRRTSSVFSNSSEVQPPMKHTKSSPALLSPTRLREEDEDRDSAATRLQASYRGVKARRLSRELSEASKVERSLERAKEAGGTARAPANHSGCQSPEDLAASATVMAS